MYLVEESSIGYQCISRPSFAQKSQNIYQTPIRLSRICKANTLYYAICQLLA